MPEPSHPKITVIGGGTGSYTVLSGLKNYTENITAVVNMTDDGGSSGDLRDELGVLPPGDVRQCLIALSNNDVLRKIFDYRLKGAPGKLENHPLGNILLSGIEQMTGDAEEAINQVGLLLNITGQVVPATTTKAKVHAQLPSGTILRSEELVGHMQTGSLRPKIWLDPEAPITDGAKAAIANADMVVIAPGNLYGSLAPVLTVQGMRQALEATNARIVYVCNLVTKPGQTEDFMAHDFADEIERFIGAKVLDYLIYNTDPPTDAMLRKYTHEGEYPLEYDLEIMSRQHYQAVGLPLIAKDPVIHAENDRLKSRRTLIRHDSESLAKEVIRLLGRK